MCPAVAQPTGEAPPPTPAAAAAECLTTFLKVQEERAAAYRLFDQAFKAYLDTASEGPYRFVMSALTTEFQELSGRVMALEVQLQGGAASAVQAAAALRSVQVLEREKLHLTLSLHTLRASLAHERFSWQHEGHAGAGCGCGAAAAEAGEPVQGEVEGACRESTQALEACVREINEALDEVRQLRQELLDGEGGA